MSFFLRLALELDEPGPFFFSDDLLKLDMFPRRFWRRGGFAELASEAASLIATLCSLGYSKPLLIALCLYLFKSAPNMCDQKFN